MTEVWLPIPGYPYYEASSLGRIRRKAGTPRRPKVARILHPRRRKPRKGRLPYLDVHLSHDGQHSFETVHKLVALAFLGPKPAGHENAHWDGNPTHNSPDNLRWATPTGNKLDCVRHGNSMARDVGARRRNARGSFAPEANV